MEKKMLSIHDAAEHFGLSEYFVRNLVKSRKVCACRIRPGAGKILVNVQSLSDYLDNCSLDDDQTTQCTDDDYDIHPIDLHI